MAVKHTAMIAPRIRMRDFMLIYQYLRLNLRRKSRCQISRLLLLVLQREIHQEHLRSWNAKKKKWFKDCAEHQ